MNRNSSFPTIFNLLLFVSLLIPRAALSAVTDLSGPPNAAACPYSDRLYESDVALLLRRSPTRFRLMPSRYISMVQAERGLQCTGTATVAFDGHDYTQAGRSDDPGIMELVPTVSRLSGLSVANSYDLIILVLVLSATVIGFAGFLRLHSTWRMRWAGAAVFFCIAIAEARVADEYVFQIAPLIAGIPWLIYLGMRQRRVALPICAALLAFCCSFCSIVRSGSVVICLAFLIPLFIARYRHQNPILPVLLILVSCVPSFLFARSLVARRNRSLVLVGGRALTVDSHPIWHTLYIGLGYIPNSEVPAYRDGVAADKVRSIDPTAPYTSTEYQDVLRHELWSMVKRRPLLVFGVFAAKAAVVLLLTVMLLLPARRLIFADRALLWMDISFLSAIAMSAMNGIIAVPRISYLLTFLCLSFLYTFFKVCDLKFELLPAGSSSSKAYSDPKGYLTGSAKLWTV